MRSYANGCSSLTSLSVPDTSGLTSVGSYFMRYYAQSCTSLTSFMLPSATGWFESHNISWGVPSTRLNYLYGYAPSATSQTAWQALTASGKTLYLNYIQSSSYVKVIGAKLPKFFLYYARMRGN
jgi:4-alpha-glucanotransferase